MRPRRGQLTPLGSHVYRNQFYKRFRPRRWSYVFKRRNNIFIPKNKTINMKYPALIPFSSGIDSSLKIPPKVDHLKKII